MKKTILLIIILVFTFCACGRTDNTSNNEAADTFESYCYATTYTFGRFKEGEVNIVDSRAELEKYCGNYERMSKNEKYSDEWFKSHQLLVIPLILSAGEQPSVSKVSEAPEKQITINVRTPEGYLPENVNYWYCVVESGKLFSNADQIRIIVNEIIVADLQDIYDYSDVVFTAEITGIQWNDLPDRTMYYFTPDKVLKGKLNGEEWFVSYKDSVKVGKKYILLLSRPDESSVFFTVNSTQSVLGIDSLDVIERFAK